MWDCRYNWVNIPWTTTLSGHPLAAAAPCAVRCVPVSVVRKAEVPVRVLFRVTPAADVTAHHADPEVVRNAAGFAVELSAWAHGTVKH